MSDQHKPFWERTELTFNYPGIRQVMDTCVFAANAGAVNHLAGRNVWTLGSLIDAAAKAGHWLGGPPIGEIAHNPVKKEVGYVFNDKNQSALTNHTVRQWVESEGKIVILSRPLVNKAQNLCGWHMLTLITWDTHNYITWDSGHLIEPGTGIIIQSGKMAAVYENEIEQGINYQPGATLIPHPDHHAFVYWKNNANAGQ